MKEYFGANAKKYGQSKAKLAMLFPHPHWCVG